MDIHIHFIVNMDIKSVSISTNYPYFIMESPNMDLSISEPCIPNNILSQRYFIMSSFEELNVALHNKQYDLALKIFPGIELKVSG
jgi:hypothetical protein